MEGELGEVLGDHRDHAGVVRSRRDLAEENLVPGDEELDPEDPASAEGVGDLAGDPLGLLLGGLGHRLGLPALPVIAVLLDMANRCTERGAPGVADGKQGDLIVEVDETLDDHPALAGAAGAGGVIPRRSPAAGRAHDRLPLATGGHHRLDHAGNAELGHRRLDLFAAVAKPVRGGRQAELLGGQAPDPLAVHRQPGSAGGRDDPHAGLLEPLELAGGDRLDLGDDDHLTARPGRLFLEEGAQRRRVGHVDHGEAVGDLHRRRARVTVDGDDLAAQPLGFEGHFAAQLAGTEQHEAKCVRRARRADRHWHRAGA